MILDHLASEDLLSAAPDACLLIDKHGAIRAANDLGSTMFGYPADSLLNLHIDDLVPVPLRAAHAQHRSRYLQNSRSRAMGSGLALTAQKADGSVFPVEVSLSPVSILIDDHVQQLVIAAIRDVTEQSRIRERLAASRRVAALAEERERLARDLHDTVIQEIFAVGLSLQSAAGLVDDPTAARRVNQAIDDLDRVIRHIRTAIFGLTSHRDWGRGLRGEILRVAADHQDALGFEPTVVFDGDIDTIADPIVAQLLPVLTEALSNVAQHAQATRCDVIVERRDTKVTLSVTDDGFATSAMLGAPTDAGRGKGMSNLRRRAAVVGGTFDFGPAEIAGSRLTWTAPE